jgi:uncharacterized OB-fold protein
MEETKPPKPALFQREGTAQAPNNHALLGGECSDCGYVFFPMRTYGCERCGGINLAARALTGRGRVLTRATVHEHHGPGRTAPFTVAAVLTEDGPMVRAVLDPATENEIEIGSMVVTTLVPETRPDRGEFDLRLTREVR